MSTNLSKASTELAPESIEKGTHVTISRWLEVRDYSRIGDLMHVVEVSGPFVMVDITPKHGNPFRHTLDSRQVQFCLLSPEFVEAAKLTPTP